MKNKTDVEFLIDRLKELFSRDEHFVLKINGKWGVGKTHFWNYFSENHLDKNIAYVSLFGKETIQDIKTDIILQISKKDAFINSVSGSILNIRSNLGLKEEELNFGVNGSFISSMMTLLKKKDFKDVIVCFDDFERLSKKLEPRDLLGLVSELREQKSCHVVMILNQDKIEDDSLSIYKDKIIDYEFEFSPTPEEAYGVVKDTLTTFKEYPLKYFQKNNINNIRVMKRVVNSLNDFSFVKEYTKGFESIEIEIVERIIELSTINTMFLFDEFRELEQYCYDRAVHFAINHNNGKVSEFSKNKIYEEILLYVKGHDFSINDLSSNIIKYLKSSMIYKNRLIKIINKRKEQTNISQMTEDIRNLRNKLDYNLNYNDSEFVKDLFELLTDNSSKLVNTLSSDAFILSINSLKELDSSNEEKYQVFAIEHLKKYIEYFFKYDEESRRYYVDDFIRIKNFDLLLEDFINQYELKENRDKIDNLEKIIELMVEPGYIEGKLLSLVSRDNIKRYILEKPEFVRASFHLINYMEKVSSESGIEIFIKNIYDTFEELKESDNKNHKVKMTRLLNSINK